MDLFDAKDNREIIERIGKFQQTTQEWSRFQWSYLNHHLTQFGA
jgi:hypothetical protein